MFRAARRSSSGAPTVFAASGSYTHVVTARSQVWYYIFCILHLMWEKLDLISDVFVPIHTHTHTHTHKWIISTFLGPTPNLLGLCLCFSPVLNRTTIIHFLKFVIVAPVARMCIELAVNYRVIKKVSVHLTITVQKKHAELQYFKQFHRRLHLECGPCCTEHGLR
jgi:hypothetical protein